MSDYEFLDIEPIGDGVAVVYLHRSPVNAVHQPMYQQLHELFSRPEMRTAAE